MAFRLYLVPVVGDGTRPAPRRPKYFASDATGAGLAGMVRAAWSGVDYGQQPWMIVGADLSSSDDTALVAEPDALGLPFDLTPTLTAPQVTNVSTVLENAKIPAGWVTTSLTWLTVVRTVLGMCAFLQRYNVIYTQQNAVTAPSLFAGGATLSTTFGSLPLAVRTALSATATDLGLSTAGVTGSTTVRALLKGLADQVSQARYQFGSTVI